MSNTFKQLVEEIEKEIKKSEECGSYTDLLEAQIYKKILEKLKNLKPDYYGIKGETVWKIFENGRKEWGEFEIRIFETEKERDVDFKDLTEEPESYRNLKKIKLLELQEGD